MIGEPAPIESLRPYSNPILKTAEIILDASQFSGALQARENINNPDAIVVQAAAIQNLQEWAGAVVSGDKSKDTFDLTSALIPTGHDRMSAMDTWNLAIAVFGINDPHIKTMGMEEKGFGSTSWEPGGTIVDANTEFVNLISKKWGARSLGNATESERGVFEFTCPTIIDGVLAEVKTRNPTDFLEKLNSGKGNIVFEYVRLKFLPQVLDQVRPLDEILAKKLMWSGLEEFGQPIDGWDATSDPQGYYKLLGIDPKTPAEQMQLEIKKAYRVQARMYHSDMGNKDEASLEKMKKINEAYDFLTKRDKRTDKR